MLSGAQIFFRSAAISQFAILETTNLLLHWCTHDHRAAIEKFAQSVVGDLTLCIHSDYLTQSRRKDMKLIPSSHFALHKCTTGLSKAASDPALTVRHNKNTTTKINQGQK